MSDHASTTYGLPDYARMREIDQLFTSTIATHPDICRQIQRHLRCAGLQLLSHQSQILSECGRETSGYPACERGFARLIPALGILPEAEGKVWVDHMFRSHEAGTFFAAGAYYTFHALRP